MITLAEGRLAMNGATVEWPPKDANGQPIEIGALVLGMRDTLNFFHEHRFIVGGLRLQNVGGELVWCVCAYDDVGSYYENYYECRSDDCIVVKRAPR